ncbi:MAG: hypothetical protein JWR01_2109 [Subtercola sp.]|nr:hypothetical protein [Subtercola sp.]
MDAGGASWRRSDTAVALTKEVDMDQTLPLSGEDLLRLARIDDRVVVVDTPEVFIGVKTFQPGEVFANHFHEGYDEFFACLEGTVTVWTGRSARVELQAGSTLLCPRGSHHRLENRTDLVARTLYVKTPPTESDTIWVDWSPAA